MSGQHHAHRRTAGRNRRGALLASALVALGLAPAVASAGDISCALDGSTGYYACTLPTDPGDNTFTLSDVLTAVDTAGGSGTVTQTDPAMWLTGFGAPGGLKDNYGGDGGYAQTPISASSIGTSTALYYWVGSSPAESDWPGGGGGGASTIVATAQPPRSSPGAGLALSDVLVVAGGGGGAGGANPNKESGSPHSGGDGGAAIATFEASASAAGSDGGSGGDGGNADGDGAGGAGNSHCSSGDQCDGGDGVGGFGGVGGTDVTGAQWVNVGDLGTAEARYALFAGIASDDYAYAQTPGGGGSSPTASCTNDDPCGGGGGGGYGGGGAGGRHDSTREGAGGGGGSYAALGTCDTSLAAPSVSGRGAYSDTDGVLMVHVAPTTACESDGAVAASIAGAADTGSAAGPAQAHARPPRPPKDLFRRLSPTRGTVEKVSGGDLRREFRIQLVPGARIATARLNGKGVKRRFRRVGRMRWAATLTRRDGLAIGKNRLLVRARLGRHDDYDATSVTLAKEANLVGVGLSNSSGPGLAIVRSQVTQRPAAIAAVNARRVGDDYIREGADDDREVRLTASSGLRHGTNTVRVHGWLDDGRSETATRIVTIPDSHPIAGPGPDQRVGPSQRVTLDASDSIAPKGGRIAKYTWRLSRRPAGSGAELSAAATGTAAATASTRTATSTTSSSPSASFRPDANGTYTATLTVTSSSGLTSTASSDIVVDALPLAPIATLQTSGDDTGITIEDQWFCNGDGTDTSCLFHAGGSKAVQLFVIDRSPEASTTSSGSASSLEVTATESYAVDEMDDLANYIASLDGDTTKIVVLQVASSSDAITDIDTLNTAIGDIGASALTKSTLSGPWSIIGIPGMTAGNATANYGSSIGSNVVDSETDGGIAGYLKDSAYYTGSSSDSVLTTGRTFMWDQVRTFELRADADGTTVDAVRMGWDQDTDSFRTESWVDDIPADTSSPSITAIPVDIRTLDPSSAGSATTVSLDADHCMDWATLGTTLQTWADKSIGVVMVATGQLGGYDDATSCDQSDFGDAVLPALRDLGAQPDTFARMVNSRDSDAKYSMLAMNGSAVESSSAVFDGVDFDGKSAEEYLGQAPPQADGNLTGELRRRSNGYFAPVTADPTATSGDFALSPLMLQAPTDWESTPAADATSASGDEIALAWLAQCEAVSDQTTTPWDDSAPLWVYSGSDGTQRDQNCTDDASSTDGTFDVSVANVRKVALELRAEYSSDLEFGLNDIAALSYAGLFPDGISAFDEDDFETAKTVLTDERTSISVVENTLFTCLEAPFTGGSGTCATQTTVSDELEDIGAAIEEAYFSDESEISISSYTQLSQSEAENTAYTVGAILSLAGTASGEGLLTSFGGFASGLGSALGVVFAELEGPTTGYDVDAWDYVDDELTGVDVSVETAVSNSLALATLGFDYSQEYILSDSSRLQDVATYANGAWSGMLTTDNIVLAAEQVEAAGRIQIWAQYAQDLWDVAEVDYSDTTAPAFTTASACGSDHEWVRSGGTGTPTGIGGSQYWPLQDTPSPYEFPSWDAYVAYEQDDTDTSVDPSLMKQIFVQPGSSEDTTSGTAAGAYAPDFFDQTFDLTNVADCSSSKPKISEGTGTFYGGE